jgi:multicomponent Na+:H+ antiporter subunit B
LDRKIVTLISAFLFLLLVIIALLALRLTHLFAVVMLSGAFSMVSAVLFVVMDAVDVAFTEAAVGAGISTVLMLATMALTARREEPKRSNNLAPLLVVLFVGCLLVYGTLDMPNYGSNEAPAQTHLSAQYLNRTPHDIGIPNVVTAILASYRGFDTLGETAVVFTAGVGVILLIGGTRRRRSKGGKSES